ncbi:uncharacterized protein LOC115219661 [Octopus sinensis]|uniref:Uncharacterized protein LOC115219661 n=1 Tax=Octopus sinensis TaxID=2607531 RepID=A0A6P7T793_9MOLL|nr:uncharacterized protein LOC115219661 [Octopus sinensis]
MELAVLYYSYIFDSDVACRVIRFCVCLATVTSGMIVFIIALDRYLLISRPRAKKITVVKAKKILKYLILFSLISSTPTLVLYGIHFRMVGQCENIGTDCTISSQVADTPYPLIYHLILGALCYSLYTFILVIYLMIGKSVWRAVTLKSLKKINFIDSSITTDTSTQNPNQSQSRSQSRSRSRSQSEDKGTEGEETSRGNQLHHYEIRVTHSHKPHLSIAETTIKTRTTTSTKRNSNQKWRRADIKLLTQEITDMDNLFKKLQKFTNEKVL